jgi:hypothetical protein
MTGKWLEMLTQISPPVACAAVLFDPKTALYAGLMLREIEQAARSLAVAVRAAPCSDARARRARWAVGSAGSVRRYTSPRHYCPRCPLPPGSSISHPRVRRVRRDDVLWDRQYRCGPPSGRLCRSHPQGRQSRRSAGATADEVRADDQSENRESARHRRAADAARHRGLESSPQNNSKSV